MCTILICNYAAIRGATIIRKQIFVCAFFGAIHVINPISNRASFRRRSSTLYGEVAGSTVVIRGVCICGFDTATALSILECEVSPGFIVAVGTSGIGAGK